ncbi:AlpA family phage regulatory protein [Pseudodesulfovibrio sp.]|nr:AlpA family phage regulatory protein [Pseudodesulfovibrio sp.]
MSNVTPAIEVHFLRLPQVLKRFPVSKSHWWDGIQKGIYPRGIKLSKRCTAWKSTDIDALIERVSASGEAV